jgi:crotonobetainyl-CoA:carnitine CoA-transferase CaiB-like acyl-CoA transferase
MAMLTYPATWYLTGGIEVGRTASSAHPSLVPFQNFKTSDGWIVVACGKEKFWQRFAGAIGRPELAVDDRFGSFPARRTHAQALLAILEEVMATKTSKEWLLTLSAAGVPCGPVNTISEALADGHTGARGLVVETEHPRFGTVRQLASPVRVGTHPVEYRHAPTRHEASEYVLRELLGYDEERIAAFTESGAFGTAPLEP